MIVDLSCPDGHSVNDRIAKALCSLHYSSLDDAVQFSQTLGVGTHLIKIDLRNAYRIVPLHPQDCHLFGICWEDCAYVVQALPFGLRSAPKLFTAVEDSMGWALSAAGIPLHIHYPDNFFVFHPSVAWSKPTLLGHILAFLEYLGIHILAFLEYLGIPVALHKIEGPATTVTFLGIVVNAIRGKLRLPHHKIDDIQQTLQFWRTQCSDQHSKFESMVSHLAYASMVVQQSRTFLRNLYIILNRPEHRRHYVHLDSEARADLCWWH